MVAMENATVTVTRHALARYRERIDPAGTVADVLGLLVAAAPATARHRVSAALFGDQLNDLVLAAGGVTLIVRRPSPRRLVVVTVYVYEGTGHAP